MATYSTADLCDKYPATVKVADPIFQNFGEKQSFSGQIDSIKVHEDTVLIENILKQPGNDRVLIVDGGGSLRCALLDHSLVQLAFEKNWQGIIVYGCIRHALAIAKIPIGLKALNVYPLKSNRRGRGDRNVPVTFAGVTFFPGHYVYADVDGIIVAENLLTN